MPDSLETLLQQHVDQLSHAPATGFPGVRAKARRRSRQRVAAASLTVLSVLAVFSAVSGTFPRPHNGPAAPRPRPSLPLPGSVQLTGTRWLLQSVTDNGHTTRVAENEAFLVMGWDGQWLLHTGCGNVAGLLSFGGSVGLTMRSAPTDCAKEPLGDTVKLALASGAVAHLGAGDQPLTLTNEHATLRFRVGPPPDTSVLTTRAWRVASYIANGTSAEVPASSQSSLWRFGADSFTATDAAGESTGCNPPTGLVVVSNDVMDFGGTDGFMPVCPGTPTGLQAAYSQLAISAHAAWHVQGQSLTISNPAVTIGLVDAGPNPGGSQPTRPSQPGTPSMVNDPALSVRLAGTWQLFQVMHGADKGSLPAGVGADVTFDKLGHFSGTDGCNSVSGTLVVGNGTLVAGGWSTTQVDCVSAGGAMEPLVDAALLWSPSNWSAQDDTLTLSGGGVTLIYGRSG
jgi:heat shock protein HslJ